MKEGRFDWLGDCARAVNAGTAVTAWRKELRRVYFMMFRLSIL
jgi:hypothetical protein